MQHLKSLTRPIINLSPVPKSDQGDISKFFTELRQKLDAQYRGDLAAIYRLESMWSQAPEASVAGVANNKDACPHSLYYQPRKPARRKREVASALTITAPRAESSAQESIDTAEDETHEVKAARKTDPNCYSVKIAEGEQKLQQFTVAQLKDWLVSHYPEETSKAGSSTLSGTIARHLSKKWLRVAGQRDGLILYEAVTTPGH